MRGRFDLRTIVRRVGVVSLRPPRGCRLLGLLAVIASLNGLLSSGTLAQETPAVRKGSAGIAGGAVGEAGAATALSPDDRRLPPGENGTAPEAPLTVEPMPASPPPDPAIPAYHVSEVNVEGAVSGDKADLTVRVNVEINRASGWYDVPLRLGQAHIFRQTSSGVGSRLPGQPTLQDDGLHWRFFGQGQHTLEFQMGVPVRTTPAGRQLQLSLPVMPPLFEALVRLKLSGGNFVVRSPNRDAALRSTFDPAKNETIVEGGVPGGRLDLTWQDRSQRPPADGAAVTNYTLRRLGVNWQLEAHQTIVRMETSSNEMLAQAPEGFKVAEVKGDALESWTPLEDRPGWIRLSFPEGTGDRVVLNWRLTRAFAQAGEVLPLSGLHPDGVRTHEGSLRIVSIPGFQIVPDNSSRRYIERVDDAPQSGESAALLAYAFSAGGWKLSLTARPVEPLFACKPRLDVSIREDLASLNAVFELREEAGDVSRLVVEIGTIEAAGWTLSTTPRTGLSAAVMTRDGPVVTFEWPGGSASRKQAELRFERPISGAEFSFDVPMPLPRATWLESATVSVRAADQLRIDVAGGASASDSRLDAAPPSETSRLIGVYQPSDPSAPVSVHGSVEARTVSATANVLVEAVESRRITIEQQIALDVRYGRLPSLRLLIPDGFPVTPGAERLAFQVWVDGREATGLEWTSGSLRIPFPRPRIGLIRVSVRYALPRQSEQSTMTLPVVLTPDVKFHEVTLEASLGARVGVSPASSQWNEITTSSDRRRWSAEPDANSVDLVFEKEHRPAHERAVISAAFIRTDAAADGIQWTVAAYDIQRSGETLSFTLPPAATPHEITLNGQPADVIQGTDSTPENQWIIRMPANAAATSSRLEITFDVASMPRGAIGRLKVGFPQFAQGTFVEQIVWKLTLPETDVLVGSPLGATPLFEWQRRGVFWRRVLSSDYAESLKAANFPATDAEAGGEGYAFRQIGGPVSLTVWTIDRSLVILIGAGVTLILGFLFWSVRRLQNVVTFLLLAFLISIAGLWFSEAIQVLLQPALIGVAMALVATAIDGRARRRRTRAPARESSIHPAVRSSAAKANDPLRSTILRPAGSDHGAPR